MKLKYKKQGEISMKPKVGSLRRSIKLIIIKERLAKKKKGWGCNFPISGM